MGFSVAWSSQSPHCDVCAPLKGTLWSFLVNKESYVHSQCFSPEHIVWIFEVQQTCWMHSFLIKHSQSWFFLNILNSASFTFMFVSLQSSFFTAFVSSLLCVFAGYHQQHACPCAYAIQNEMGTHSYKRSATSIMLRETFWKCETSIQEKCCINPLAFRCGLIVCL